MHLVELTGRHPGTVAVGQSEWSRDEQAMAQSPAQQHLCNNIVGTVKHKKEKVYVLDDQTYKPLDSYTAHAFFDWV